MKNKRFAWKDRKSRLNLLKRLRALPKSTDNIALQTFAANATTDPLNSSSGLEDTFLLSEVTLVSREVAERPDLKAAAKGLYVDLCHFDFTFENFSVRTLVNRSPAGKRTIVRLLKALAAKGIFIWPPKRHIVYVIKNNVNGLFKIGYTFGYDAQDREDAIAIAEPDTKVMLELNVTDRRVERQVHAHFAHCRRFGEWFALSPEDLEKLPTLVVKPELPSTRVITI